MNALRAFWAGLGPRDQRILVIGAVFVATVVVWLGIWEPLREARDAARIRVMAAANDLATMRAVAPQLATLTDTSAPAARDGRSLLALVDATARSAAVGDALLRVEPVAGDRVRAYFEGAGFDALVQWLGELEAGQGVVTSELSVNRAGGVGRVDARVLLQRSGG